jgi:hypothetical protein
VIALGIFGYGNCWLRYLAPVPDGTVREQ